MWWNSETQSNWWDGYLRNVLLLDHADHMQKVKDYIVAKLNTADDDGYIGIYGDDLRYKHTTENGELWAQASLFRGLLAYYEATNDRDVLNAVIKAVNVTMLAYPINESVPFKTEKAFAGVGHGLTFVDILNSLFRITGDKQYLDYALFLYNDYSRHPQPEEDIQLANLLNEDYLFKGHGVHTYEHLRALTLAAYHSDDEKYQRALAGFLSRLESVTTDSGGPIGDEWIAGRHAHHSDTGYEYCSIQELLHSYVVLLQKTGDAQWADKIEWLLFNAGQGARHPDGKSIAYCKTDNSYDVLGHLDMANPQGEKRFKYSPAHQDVAVCCAPNAGRVYPYYVSNSWQKTSQGLLASLYGPGKLTTQLKGSEVVISQVTDYPFSHQIEMTVTVAKPMTFALQLRQPAWASETMINGVVQQVEAGLVTVNKHWTGKEQLTLTFTTEPVVNKQGNNRATISYGPLLYALPFEHKAITHKSYEVKGFEDLFFKNLNRKNYAWLPGAEVTLSNKTKKQNWQMAPVLKTQMFDRTSSEKVAVELVPMGNTILREVSFEIYDNKGK